MKNLVLLLALLGFASCKPRIKAAVQPAQPEYADLSLSSLSRLFKDATVKNGEILWKPDQSEKEAFEDHLSSDQYCHTVIDTVMKLKGRSYVIFNTIQYENGLKSDFHAYAPYTGIASFDQQGNGYKMVKFKKDVYELGGYGASDGATFDKLGSMDVFKVAGGSTWMGETWGYEAYYSCEDFRRVCEFTSYFSNDGTYEEGKLGYQVIEKKIIGKTSGTLKIEALETTYDSLGVVSKKKTIETVEIH